MRSVRLAAAVGVSSLLFVPWIGVAQEGEEPSAVPRALSPAERQAVVYALDYLEGGAGSWWPHLAESSPLARLGREDAVRELAVRAGPAEGSVWRLETVDAGRLELAVLTVEFPSGVTDTLFLELIEEPGGWKIGMLRSAAEGRMPTAPEAPRPAPVPVPPPPADSPAALPAVVIVLAALGALLLLATRQRKGWLALPAGALALGIALWLSPPAAPPPASGATGAAGAAAGGAQVGQAGLGSLLPLRRAMARPEPAAGGEAVEPPSGSAAARVARLWQAQQLLLRQDSNGAQKLLDTFPFEAEVPLLHLLRARLALMRLEAADAARAYERALEVGVGHDALLLEAAQAFLLLGFPERARRCYAEFEALRSRRAEGYYDLARLAVLESLYMKAASHFQTAWRLRPRERITLMADPLTAYLLEVSVPLGKIMALHSAREPAAGCDAPADPLVLPAGARARRLGGLLAVELSRGELLVPGGCALAPVATAVLDAAAWTRTADDRVLAELPAIRRAAATPGALPGRRAREAAEALLRRRRWGEILGLTEGFAGEAGGLPADLARIRATALQRLGRSAEARGLLTELLRRNAASRQVDLLMLYQLTDVLITDQQHELALRVIGKIDRSFSIDYNDNLIRRIQVERRLEKLERAYEADGFRLIYPLERSPLFAEAVGRILVAERQRLAEWIPGDSGEEIEVYLLPAEDFLKAYSQGMDIVGLYDGRIRLPLGEMLQLPMEFIGIISHELAHAMITDATDNMAPRWLQEGLAQHLEPIQIGLNPIPEMLERGELLPFPLLEGVLESRSSMTRIQNAYLQAMWAVHFIETRYGTKAIRGLIAAFAEGATTEEAIAEVLGRTLLEFDDEMRVWCLHEAPRYWPSSDVRYSRDIH